MWYRKKEKIITKIVDTLFRSNAPRAAHTLCSDQNQNLAINSFVTMYSSHMDKETCSQCLVVDKFSLYLYIE